MFVQVIQGTVSSPQDALRHVQTWVETMMPEAIGFLGVTAGVTDDAELVSVVRFRSAADASANAERGEQDAWWNEFEKWFVDPPRFLDCDEAVAVLGGGSDRAGFVQVIQGHVDDRDTALAAAEPLGGAVRAGRPDVLGGLLAVSDDGVLTEVVYFSSEEEARAHEARAPSAEDEDAGAQWLSSVRDLRFLDLRQPLLDSHPVDGDDVAELHRRAVAEFDRRVAAIGDADWQRPTPCSEWSVHDLVEHVVSEDRWAPELLAGRTIEEVGDRFEGDLLGDEPLRRWGEAATAATRAVGAPQALEQTVHASFGDIPATEYVQQLFADHLIHAWDLARAIGADESLPEDLVEACARWFDEVEDDYREWGVIGAPTELPPDADAARQLLARFGRDGS